MSSTTKEDLKNTGNRLEKRLGVFDESAVTFSKSRATQAAAGLAYYTFFSIFPLMLLLILIGSFFLDRQNMLQRVTQFVQGVLPVPQQFVVQNLQTVLKSRAAVGIFVLVSLLWSASSMFDNLAYEINQAWPEAKARGLVQSRLIGIDMILGLTVLMLVSIILDSLTKWLAGPAPASGPLGAFNPLALVASLGSWLAIFILFLAMYHWVPTVDVSWSASAWGAVAATIGWKAATTAFAWYLSSPFAHYESVYGALGGVVAFLFLIYIIALVTLFGAHLTAAIDHAAKQHASKRAADALPGAQPVAVTGKETDDTSAIADERSAPRAEHERTQQQAQEEASAEPAPYPKLGGRKDESP
jgi:membrane protein